MTRPPEILTSPLCSGLPFARRHQPDSVPDRRQGPRGTACSASPEHRNALPASPTGQRALLSRMEWPQTPSQRNKLAGSASPAGPAPPHPPSPANTADSAIASACSHRSEPTAAPRSGRRAAIAKQSAAAHIPPQPTRRRRRRRFCCCRCRLHRRRRNVHEIAKCTIYGGRSGALSSHIGLKAGVEPPSPRSPPPVAPSPRSLPRQPKSVGPHRPARSAAAPRSGRRAAIAAQSAATTAANRHSHRHRPPYCALGCHRRQSCALVCHRRQSPRTRRPRAVRRQLRRFRRQRLTPAPTQPPPTPPRPTYTPLLQQGTTPGHG